MKQRFFTILLALALLLSGCAAQKSEPSADILATTAPVAQIVGAITAGTDLTVATLISEPVSCVHDYALSVDQMRAVEQAKLIVISGAGLEEFMGDTLASCDVVIDASEGLALLPGEEGESDPHTWLAPENMIAMTHTAARRPVRGKRGHLVRKTGRAAVLRRAASCRSLLPQARHLPRRLRLLCQGF